MKAIFAPLAFVVLVACDMTMPPPSSPTSPMPENDTCGARPYAALIGQDATALERVLIMREVRIIRPGTAVTMDYSAQRINFMIDTAERVSQISCG